MFALGLNAYLEKYKLLSPDQFGFRRNRSTEQAIIQLTDFVSYNLDSHKCVFGMFYDVSKAFDSLDHNVLLHKLQCYGIRGKVLDWIKSYLSDRMQYVVNNGKVSLLNHVSHGVPQGSNIGPLLFIIYINDLTNVVKNVKFILFADDTTMLMPCSNSNSDRKVIQNNVDSVAAWFECNRLMLNTAKTHALLFTLCKQSYIEPVSLHGSLVPFVEHVKFLGCYVDGQLRWGKHVEHVCNSISSGIAMLRASRTLFPVSVKLNIYYALIYSHMTYCITVWFNAAAVYISDIVRLQKCAIRLVVNAHKFAHTMPIACELSVLLLNEVYQYKIACCVYGILHNSDLDNLTHKLSYVSSKSVYLRNKTNLVTCYSRTCVRYNAFLCSGIRVWNSLPSNIRSCCSACLFKKTLVSMAV